MSRLPRDISGDELIRSLRSYDYETTRQTGSHVRLTRTTTEGQQHLTVPRHRSLRVGTLNSILGAVAVHIGKSKDEVVVELFG